MPIFEDMVEDQQMLFRILAYGAAKTKKTWWAGTAAEAGYNVIFFNGDDGIQILKNLSSEARKRIRIIDAKDKFSRPYYAPTLGLFLSGKPFAWNDTLNEAVNEKLLTTANPDHAYFILDATKLTPNDVVIFDSWTAFQSSLTLQFARENSIDLTDGERIEWDGYGFSSRYLDWALNKLSSLNCHVIVVGHAEKYEKQRPDPNNPKKTIIEFTRVQPISSSRNHAMHLAKHFSDVLFFELIGESYYVDTRAHGDRDGGSRIIAPKRYKWDEIPFSKLAEEGHARPADKDAACEACLYLRKGELPAYLEARKAQAVPAATAKSTPTINAQNPAALSLGSGNGAAQIGQAGKGLAALMHKK